MLEILKSMIKEEWRIHSTLFGSFMFAMFPVILAAFSFADSLLLPVLVKLASLRQIVLSAHYGFVLLGMSVGAFGIFGREMMNRRFGHASLIAYSARTLPVSEKEIFLNFFVKDIIYYFFLWILPFVAGFAAASPLLSISVGHAGILLATLTLSFLIGLALSFLLSTIYAHSSRLFVAALLVLAVAGIFAAGNFNASILELLPPFIYFFTQSSKEIVSSLTLVIIPSSLSLAFFKSDYPVNSRNLRNAFVPLANRLGFTSQPQFVAKDFLDLKRSEGGAGKIIFSFLFPVGLIWLVLFAALKIMPAANFFVIFAILLGAVSSMVYNWLTEFDLFSAYSFLPVRVSDVMKSKIVSYALINSVSVAILVLAGMNMHEMNYFLPALLSLISVSAYALSVTVYLCGLYPNILLYNAKILAEYLLSISPVLLVLMVISIFNPFYLIASPVLIPISGYLIKRSYEKWNAWEHPSF